MESFDTETMSWGLVTKPRRSCCMSAHSSSQIPLRFGQPSKRSSAAVVIRWKRFSKMKMPRSRGSKSQKFGCCGLWMDPIDEATAKKYYEVGLKLANPAQIWAAVEEIKRGGGYTVDEILKDEDAKKTRDLRRRKRKSK